VRELQNDISRLEAKLNIMEEDLQAAHYQSQEYHTEKLKLSKQLLQDEALWKQKYNTLKLANEEIKM
jgi:hypothetical protein